MSDKSVSPEGAEPAEKPNSTKLPFSLGFASLLPAHQGQTVAAFGVFSRINRNLRIARILLATWRVLLTLAGAAATTYFGGQAVLGTTPELVMHRLFVEQSEVGALLVITTICACVAAIQDRFKWTGFAIGYALVYLLFVPIATHLLKVLGVDASGVPWVFHLAAVLTLVTELWEQRSKSRRATN